MSMVMISYIRKASRRQELYRTLDLHPEPLGASHAPHNRVRLRLQVCFATKIGPVVANHGR
jgi:hypothetical protein